MALERFSPCVLRVVCVQWRHANQPTQSYPQRVTLDTRQLFPDERVRLALALCALLTLSPTDHHRAVLTFVAGTGLGYFPERWGTTRECWTHYTGQTPWRMAWHGGCILASRIVGQEARDLANGLKLMLSLSTARKLKTAGLMWTPRLHDFFVMPDRGMDDHVFVLSDVSVDVGLLKGQSIVTFNGTTEWALDYEMMAEVIWMPTEEQLRDALEQRLEAPPALTLSRTPNGYRCEVQLENRPFAVRGANASEAYAEALLALLGASR